MGAPGQETTWLLIEPLPAVPGSPPGRRVWARCQTAAQAQQAKAAALQRYPTMRGVLLVVGEAAPPPPPPAPAEEPVFFFEADPSAPGGFRRIALPGGAGGGSGPLVHGRRP
jgi:hypothetical protein